jgi:hypothetical protein
VLVDDLDVMRVSLDPTEANPPLIVDSNTILTHEITSRAFQPIGRRDPKILDQPRLVQHPQFAQRGVLDLGR